MWCGSSLTINLFCHVVDLQIYFPQKYCSCELLLPLILYSFSMAPPHHTHCNITAYWTLHVMWSVITSFLIICLTCPTEVLQQVNFCCLHLVFMLTSQWMHCTLNLLGFQIQLHGDWERWSKLNLSNWIIQCSQWAWSCNLYFVSQYEVMYRDSMIRRD